MEGIKDPRTWKRLALDGTISNFEEGIVDPGYTEDLIRQLIDDGIPKIEKEEDNEVYYVTFSDEDLEHYAFEGDIKDYLEDNSLLIHLPERD